LRFLDQAYAQDVAPRAGARIETSLPHRHSLARHLVPLLLRKETTLPSVEDCQRQRPATAVTSVIMITGTETVITIDRSAHFAQNPSPSRGPRPQSGSAGQTDATVSRGPGAGARPSTIAAASARTVLVHPCW
jgi:hypothetical protein